MGAVVEALIVAACAPSADARHRTELPPEWRDASAEGASTPSIPPVAAVDVAGRWGMRETYSDAIAAELFQDEGALTGTACSHGLPPSPAEAWQYSCGALVNGRVDGRHVRFEVKRELGDYMAVDAVASVDGQRIAGRYYYGSGPPREGSDVGWMQTTAWSRLADGQGWFDAHEGWPTDVPFSCGGRESGGYDLSFESAMGTPTLPRDRTYLLRFCAGVAGDLGAFGGPELHVTAGPDGQTTGLVAGPVSETAPGLPTRLALRFENHAVVEVEAELAAGSVLFRATPRVAPAPP